MPVRHVRLVLCTPGGELLGALPTFDVESPWWRQVDDVVDAARRSFGVDVRVLRLLSSVGPMFPGGGPVSYLAEVDRRPPMELTGIPGDPLADHPLRLRYAQPGGHTDDLNWAAEVLGERGWTVTGRQQIRTWNLSSIWRLTYTGKDPRASRMHPADNGAHEAWLKVVPPFFAHEGALLPVLDPHTVPPVLGAEPGRVLLDGVPGTDQYEATGERLLDMVRQLVHLQTEWIGRTDELLSLGVPDVRRAALEPRIKAVTQLLRSDMSDDERRRLDVLVGGLGARWAAIAECGLPDTLVHGDFHPGNVRGTPGSIVILDWGDSAVGHPMIDQLAFGRRLSTTDRLAVEREWAREWQRRVPGSDASRAAGLLRPIAALNAAVVYQHFLDNIEPDERSYHAGDPLGALRDAIAS
ncbi:phosphotransferase [Nakamurella sp. GG22]